MATGAAAVNARGCGPVETPACTTGIASGAIRLRVRHLGENTRLIRRIPDLPRLLAFGMEGIRTRFGRHGSRFLTYSPDQVGEA
jgi:hypothetical protein